MKRLSIFSLFFTLFFYVMVSSCHKEITTNSGQVKIVLSSDNLKSSLKSSTSGTFTELNSIIVTIEDASGYVVGNSLEIDLTYVNGNYVSQPLSLAKGQYKLTCLLALDINNYIVYASPLQGSVKASLVQAPLSITFDVTSNVVTQLNPEVVSVINCKPEDFGNATLGFEVKTTIKVGLIADYRFNGDAKDASGHGNDGTINGTAAYVAGRAGNANGAIDFTNNSSVSVAIGRLGSITVSAWVKMPSPTTWYPTIMEYAPENRVLYKGFFFFHLNGSIYQAQEQGKLYYSLYGDESDNSTRDDATSTSPISIDTWNHLSFTYDSVSQIAKMYINNALITTKTSTNSLYNLNLKLITIGRQLINNPDKPTNLVGCIDELWIYKRALTIEEIKSLNEL